MRMQPMKTNQGSAPATPAAPTTAGWRVDDIPYHAIDPTLLQGHDDLFFMLVSASFVEISSDLYTRNLVEYYRDDTVLSAWLDRRWQHEEVQHGVALRRYIATAWPDFPWRQVYDDFLDDYRRFCSVEQLGPTRALELAARCLVETGTATLYTALHRLSPEPVLRQLTLNIRNDEVRHYKHFLRHFRAYRQQEGTGRAAILRTLWQRAAEVDNEDAFYAFKHTFLASRKAQHFGAADYRRHRRRAFALAHSQYPFDMAAKMTLKPLALGRPLQRAAVPLLDAGLRFVIR
jgi:hypothetical protein